MIITEFLRYFFDPARWAAGGIPTRLLEHLSYVGLSLLIAAAVALPLGVAIGHTGRGKLAVVGVSNAMRGLPTLGLVTFLSLLIGFGLLPSVIALVILAVAPLLAGAYAGVAEVPGEITDAARGMGMTGAQLLLQVEIPNALPLIFGGIRNATLQLVATATVAAYVGLGGLGRFVLDGLNVRNYAQVLTGAVLAALLAIVLDLVLGVIQRRMVPRGVRLATVQPTTER